MSGNRPVISVTFKIGEQNHSAVSVWRGRNPGQYSISRDKGSDNYPGIATFRDFLTLCASVWSGKGFMNVSVESEREQRTPAQRSGGSYDRGPAPSSGSDDFGSGDDIPF